ncbi:hypothetical protein [Maridesulfovibrio sp.]|uniref:hypothetical protein n=1 Tax=Maridesulfovibrio sp. TaxID=2795000 RepID=UPI0029F4B5F5|nr:hypothetical protein [Maridesulfovibrio sp.]
MSGLTMYKQVGEPAAPDADNKVVFYVDDTGNPAVKYADGSTAKVLRDGDAFTTSEKPLLTYVATGYEGNDITVLIANYDDYMSGVEFGVKTQGGSASISKGTIVWTLPQLDVAGQVTLEVTAREFGKATSTSTATVDVELIPFNVSGLNITGLLEGAVDVKETPAVTAEIPVPSDGSYHHISSSWYVSEDGTKGNAVVKSEDDTVNLNSWTIPKGMSVGTDYKLWREVKIGNGELVFNLVSDKVTFTTAAQFNPWLGYNGTLNGQVVITNSGQTNLQRVVLMDDLNGLTVFSEPDNSDKSMLVPVSRTNILSNIWPPASEQPLGTELGTNNIIRKVSDTLAVCYHSYGNVNPKDGLVRFISRSSPIANDWVVSSPIPVNSGDSAYLYEVCVISETHLLCMYQFANDKNLYFKAVTRTSSATSDWTVGAQQTLVGNVYGSNASVAAVAVDELTFAFGFHTYETSGYKGKLLFATRPDTSSTTWTAGAVQNTADDYSVMHGVLLLNDTTVLCVDREDASTYVGRLVPFTRPDNTSNVWTRQPQIPLSNQKMSWSSLVKVREDTLLIAFQNNTSTPSYAVQTQVILKTGEGNLDWTAQDPVITQAKTTARMFMDAHGDTVLCAIVENQDTDQQGQLIPVIAA